MKKRIVLELTPDEAYTRHSEGAFLRLRDRRILFAYSRFVHSAADSAPADIVACYSADEGENWTEPVPFLKASMHRADNVMSVSLLRMRNGDLGVFYLVKQTPCVNRIYLARSQDEGESFYSVEECTFPERAGMYIVNNDRVIRLQSGRLLLPLVFHRSNMSAAGKVYMDGRSHGCFLYSDDDGRSWNESPDVVFPPFTGTHSGLQEAGAIELRNGVVWAYYRTDRMVQYESYSCDAGLHWTQAQPSRFTSPQSPMKIQRNEATGELIAVWNPIPNYNGRKLSAAGWGRTPLVYAVSADDGVHWSEERVLEDDPEHGYCYPAIFFTEDGSMLVSYCSGGPLEGNCLARTSVMKICGDAVGAKEEK